MVNGKSITFHAESNPKPEQRGRLEAIHPTNPLCRSVYLEARAGLGFQPWILSLRQEGEVVSACAAFLKTGRLNRTLEIPSLPPLPAAEMFWAGVRGICKEQNITYLSVNSIASCCDPIPVLGKETHRKAHHEYALAIEGDPWKHYSKGLKCNIKRARKAGLGIRRTVEQAACQEHLELAGHSLARRQKRGEQDLNYPNLDEMIALTQRGVGELFQAVSRDRVALSSTLILMAERGAIYFLAGTGAEGMACGASSFLVHEVIEAIRAAGKEIFYMGSAAPDTPLQYFKASFGARPMHGEAAEFVVGSRFRFELGKFAQFLRDGTSPLLRRLLARPAPSFGEHSDGLLKSEEILT